MIIRIITVGKKSSPEYAHIIEPYVTRMKAFAKIEWYFINNANLDRESKEIRTKILSNSTVVLLDETGQQTTNYELADILKTGKDISIIIGGSYGVDKAVKESAHYVVSLSKLVFPHQLVRLIVVEQLYRSMTILQNHPYHHG